MIKLSRSKMELLFECPRCFWLHNKDHRKLTMRLSQKVKLRDDFCCRLCGDWKGKYYPETGAVVEDIHAHHIIPKSQGGPDTMANLITLCDLCHGVVTPNWWRWFGIDKIENGKEKMQKLKEIFDKYLNGVRVRANYLL